MAREVLLMQTGDKEVSAAQQQQQQLLTCTGICTSEGSSASSRLNSFLALQRLWRARSGGGCHMHVLQARVVWCGQHAEHCANTQTDEWSR